MSKKEKLLNRLLSKPKDFSFRELITLLGYLGYCEWNTGKTSGSSVVFEGEFRHKIRLHKPHGSESLKEYQIKYVVKSLRKVGVIK